MKQTSPDTFFSEPLQVRLAAAVDRGDEAGVEAAVKAGADVNARGRDGYSLLYWAMARDCVAGFESLVKHGADVTRECRDPAQVSDPRTNDRPIRLSLGAKNPGFLDAILRHGFDPDFVLSRSGGETLLFGAVYDHSEPAIKTLLDAGASIDHRDIAGYTPIVSAWQICDFEAVWFLLERRADPTVGSDEGKDLAAMLKSYGSRGVLPEQREYFEKVVDELVRRGLLTRQDIVEADKPKTPNAGITVIEHAADSEAGRAISELERRERESNK
jgi:ankyrin repeat protein